MATNASIHTETWLCLRFTHLALNSFSLSATSTQKPCVVTHQERIWQHNQAAAAHAIDNNMTVSHALMLCPQLNLHERQLVNEEQRLQALAHWAYRFTSLVSIYNEHTLLLEIGKSIRLFNGLRRLLTLIANDLAEFRIDTCFGVAHTPKAGLLLSFEQHDWQSSKPSRNKQLAQARISNLAVPEITIEQLHECGFHRLSDIADIPHAELGKRFGIEFLDYLHKLFGRKHDLQPATTPPAVFEACADFAEPISNVTWIKQQLQHLLGELAGFVQQRQLVCRGFTWKLFDERNQLLATAVIPLSAQPHSAKALHSTMLELTELKFDTLSLQWSFSRIELHSKELVAKQLFNNDLFDPQTDDEDFNQLIDKLVSRLGANAVFRVAPRPELLPELANVRESITEVAAQPGRGQYQVSTNPDVEFKDQPLWLLNPPQLISQRNKQPEFEGRLQLIHGPERMVSHWWVNLQSRDYYIARQSNGRLLWLFFDRVQVGWCLHGLFG